MCEVAMLSPDSYSTEQIFNAAKRLYEQMGSSLGVVAVIDRNGSYSFPFYKAVTPDEEEVKRFVRKHHGTAARFIIHGRLATHGGRDYDAAHPIEIDCGGCDIDYVIHNGVVYNHNKIRSRTAADHDYTTDVDSEVIAHDYGSVPESFDNLIHEYEREPCYILLSPDRILIHTTHRYNMTEDAEFAKLGRTFGPDSDDESHYQDIIMTPTSSGGDA